MHSNSMDKIAIPENPLLLYVGDQSPGPAWQHFAREYNREMLHQSDLLAALGAFIMLMPSIVVIDRRSALGNEALSHIEDVLHTTPQPILIIIELGVPDCVARYGSVVRLGVPADKSPAQIIEQANDLLD